MRRTTRSIWLSQTWAAAPRIVDRTPGAGWNTPEEVGQLVGEELLEGRRRFCMNGVQPVVASATRENSRALAACV